MNKKVLLIDNNCQFNSFICFKKAIKLIINNKVEVLSNWENSYLNENFKYPALLRLIRPFFKRFTRINFSRNSIIKRDKKQCQYCSSFLPLQDVTIDHIIPISQGGPSNFTNCVVACKPCNIKKGAKTLEQANMKLLRDPHLPTLIYHNFDNINEWHKDWDFYIPK